jgi:hypothetical protein
MDSLMFLLATELPHAQLLYALLAAACLITMLRAAILVRTLFRLPGRRRISINDVAKPIDAKHLAAAALAGALEPTESQRAMLAVKDDEFDYALRMADARFAYGWDMSLARVTATKGLSRLTVLISVAIMGIGVYPTMTLVLYEPFDSSLLSAWLRGAHYLMARLAIGLLVSIVLDATALFFEGCLIRRRASWRRFRAMCADSAAKMHD